MAYANFSSLKKNTCEKNSETGRISLLPLGLDTLQPAVLFGTWIRSGVSWLWWQLVEATWHSCHVAKTDSPWVVPTPVSYLLRQAMVYRLAPFFWECQRSPSCICIKKVLCHTLAWCYAKLIPTRTKWRHFLLVEIVLSED